MLVEELIEELKFQDPKAEVHISFQYGDHGRTQVSRPIYHVTEVKTVWSEYHRANRLLDYYEDRDDGEFVIALSNEFLEY